jgi:DNA gyrase subunit A
MAEKKRNKKKIGDKGIFGAEITEEMEKAYIDYAMSVIVSRAIPSVEDGLKPVHRRILYAMKLLKLDPEKRTRKCARIVGDVLGKFHPHGDLAVYNALVRMAQPFSLRYPLVIGQGNFGSLDNDPPAAQRYTEAKLSKISTAILEDLDKETVKMNPNFDNTIDEPEILPSKIPTLLINGAAGIAVGMATNIPPHNLTEVCDGIIEYIKKPGITTQELLKTIQGPDFPTGGKITGDMEKIYTKGRGRISIRGKTEIDDSNMNRPKIIITEIPYQLNKADLIKDIAELAKKGKLPNIKDVRDESAKGKVRVVVELKKGSNPKFTENRLYKRTRLQNRFDVNLIALVKGKPERLTLRRFIKEYVRHRKSVVKKRTEFDLNKAEERIEIVRGLLKALKNINDVIKTIKKSKNTKNARKNIIRKFKLTKRQAKAILNMRLSSLTSLEQDKLKKEEKDLKEAIKGLKKILSSEKEILKVVKKEVKDVKKKYGDERRSKVVSRMKSIKEKDLIQKKNVVISVTKKGYIKRQDFKTYKEQRRGGVGVTGAKLATGDFVKQLITCSTHDYLLCFTSKGRVYWLKAFKVPEIRRRGKGKPIVNLIDIKKDESVSSILNVKKFKGEVIFSTKKGRVKKLKLKKLSRPRKTGIRVMNLPEKDELIEAKFISEDKEIMLVTKKGKAIRFKSKEVRSMGRSAYGVIGIKLSKEDRVVDLVLPEKEDKLLTVTKKGYGKRSKVKNYRLIKRAGKGVINFNVKKKTGPIVASTLADNNDSIIVSTKKGMAIRMSVKDIRVMGRNTQGVKVVRLQDGDEVSDLVKVEEAE